MALTQMLALELAKHRIRVNVICPGGVETDIEESTERRHLEKAKEPVEFPEGPIPLRRRLADPRAASRDERHLVFQSHGRALLRPGLPTRPVPGSQGKAQRKPYFAAGGT